MILGKRAPPPREAEHVVREYVRAVSPGAVRTEGDPVEMWGFLTCVLQQAYLPRWLRAQGGEEMEKVEELDVMKGVEKVGGLPPIWAVQGEQDSVVSGGFLFMPDFYAEEWKQG